MITNATLTPERDDLEDLLPWYAAGTLEPHEVALVEARMKVDAEFARRVEIAREEMEEDILSVQALPMPSAGFAARFMEKIADEKPSAPIRAAVEKAKEGLMARVGAFMAGFSRPVLGTVTAAALAVMVLQAGVIGSYVGGDGGSTPSYTTASGPETQATAAGPALLVAFQPDASFADVSAFLGEMRGTLAGGPLPGGLYKVALAPVDGKPRDLAAAQAAFKANGKLVRMVLPSK